MSQSALKSLRRLNRLESSIPLGYRKEVMQMAIEKVEYLVIISDYELMKELQIVLERSGVFWKVMTKYYDEKGEMVKRTTDESVAAGR